MNTRASCVWLGAILGLLAMVAQTQAGSYYWSGATGDWNDAANWGGSAYPVAGDFAYINNGGTALVTGGDTAAAARIYPGHGSGTTGTIEVSGSGSSLTASTHLIVG